MFRRGQHCSLKLVSHRNLSSVNRTTVPDSSAVQALTAEPEPALFASNSAQVTPEAIEEPVEVTESRPRRKRTRRIIEDMDEDEGAGSSEGWEDVEDGVDFQMETECVVMVAYRKTLIL